MSYILDALRRADSERERGGVPSLHSRQVPAGLADDDEGEAPARSARLLWSVVAGLSLTVLAVVAWLLMGRESPRPEPAPVSLAMAPAATATVPAQAAVTPAPMPTPPPAPSIAAPSPVPAAMPAPGPTPRRAAPEPAAATPTAVQEAPRALPTPKPVAKVQKRAEPDEADAPVPTVAELPDDVRRQLPQLSVSGASYSKNAASRMLILNGQVFREGDKVANDLVLEQIRLKSAVLSYKGQRYGISF